MADFSLDDYIRKTPQFRGGTKGTKQPAVMRKTFMKQPIKVAVPNKKFAIKRQYGQQQRPSGQFKQNSTGIKGRLGQPQHTNTGTGFRVTGLGNVQDARQKLSQKKVPDAREKIMAKTKFVDARVRIENKKAQQQRQQQQAPQIKVTDARVKIQNAQAKVQDARQKIQARQGQKTQGQGRGGQIVVTGQGRVMSQTGVVASGSNLLKVVKNNPLAMDSMSQNGSSQTLNIFETQQNGVVTITRPDPYQHVSLAVSSQPSHIPPHMMEGGAIIQIRNDMYEAPVPQSPPPIYHHHQHQQHQQMAYTSPQPVYQQEPVYQQQLVYEDAYEEAPRPPPQLRKTAKVSVRPKPKAAAVKMKATKAAVATSRASRVTAMDFDEDMDLAETPSPIQGFKVMVTNLHPVVTQEDVVELFGAMGALKKARLVKAGTAEVVFVRKEDAITAVRKYHLRELDGRPMNVILISSGGAPKGEPTVLKRLAPARAPARISAPAPTPTPPPPPPVRRSPITGPSSSSSESHQPLKLGKGASQPSGPASLDANVLHKALFKTVVKNEPPPTPVTFTVKI